MDRLLALKKDAIEGQSREEIITVALVGMAIYISWLHFLFKWFRPRLAGWLSKKLNVTIVTSLVSGSWEISKGGTAGKALLLFFVEAVVFIGGAFGPLLIAGLLLFSQYSDVSSPQPTDVISMTPTAESAEGVIDILLGKEFVLEAGKTAVLANSNFTILNEGEGSEYYTDKAGNEVHDNTIKLIINGEIVFLSTSAPETTIGDYVIWWHPVNRLRVINVGEEAE